MAAGAESGTGLSVRGAVNARLAAKTGLERPADVIPTLKDERARQQIQ
jgi:hypothetical protein